MPICSTPSLSSTSPPPWSVFSYRNPFSLSPAHACLHAWCTLRHLHAFAKHAFLSPCNRCCPATSDWVIIQHGVWACHVASDRTESSSQVFMTVIESVCRESQWKTHSNMITCSEEISFFCEKMFPKPSPVCSLHDDATGRFVAAETFDLNEQRPDGHFQVSIRRRYRAEDYVNATKPGQLSFRCHLVVLMTSWRLGIDYKLFGDAGCDPEQITTPANGHVSIMGEETCWRTPREGATLHVTCRDGYSLYGPQSFVCRNASWTPFVASNWSRPECRSGSERPTIFAGLVYFFISTSLRMLLAFRTWSMPSIAVAESIHFIHSCRSSWVNEARACWWKLISEDDSCERRASKTDSGNGSVVLHATNCYSSSASSFVVWSFYTTVSG